MCCKLKQKKRKNSLIFLPRRIFVTIFATLKPNKALMALIIGIIRIYSYGLTLKIY